MSAYSVGLGIATVIIPLLALDAGYDPAAVGLLVAVSAGCQFTSRLALPTLLGRVPDRTLIGIASLAMVGAFILLLGSTALPVFVMAQLLQGFSRAIFWTSSQTHAIRGPGRALQRLVDVNAAGSLGTLSGPAIGGMLAVIGLPLALAVAAVASLIAAITTLWMETLPPYDRRHSAGTRHLLGRDGVDVACWASAVTGGWWSMMGSYVARPRGGGGFRPRRDRLAHHAGRGIGHGGDAPASTDPDPSRAPRRATGRRRRRPRAHRPCDRGPLGDTRGSRCCSRSC